MKRFLLSLLILVFLSPVAHAQELKRLTAARDTKQRVRAVILNNLNIVQTPLPMEKNAAYETPLTVTLDTGHKILSGTKLDYSSIFYGEAYAYAYQSNSLNAKQVKVYTHLRVKSNPNQQLTRDCDALAWNVGVQEYTIEGDPPPSGKWRVPVTLKVRLYRPAFTSWGPNDIYEQAVAVYAGSENYLYIVWDDIADMWHVTGAINGVEQDFTIFDTTSNTTTIERSGHHDTVGDTPFVHSASFNYLGGVVILRGLSQRGAGGFREDRIRTTAQVDIGTIAAAP